MSISWRANVSWRYPYLDWRGRATYHPRFYLTLTNNGALTTTLSEIVEYTITLTNNGALTVTLLNNGDFTTTLLNNGDLTTTLLNNGQLTVEVQP